VYISNSLSLFKSVALVHILPVARVIFVSVDRLFSFGKASFVKCNSEPFSSIETEPSAKNSSKSSIAGAIIVSHSLYIAPVEVVTTSCNSSGLKGKFVEDLSLTKSALLYALIRLYGQISAV
jgi:hypothetical protein